MMTVWAAVARDTLVAVLERAPEHDWPRWAYLLIGSAIGLMGGLAKDQITGYTKDARMRDELRMIMRRDLGLLKVFQVMIGERKPGHRIPQLVIQEMTTMVRRFQRRPHAALVFGKHHRKVLAWYDMLSVLSVEARIHEQSFRQHLNALLAADLIETPPDEDYEDERVSFVKGLGAATKLGDEVLALVGAKPVRDITAADVAKLKKEADS